MSTKYQRSGYIYNIFIYLFTLFNVGLQLVENNSTNNRV